MKIQENKKYKKPLYEKLVRRAASFLILSSPFIKCQKSKWNYKLYLNSHVNQELGHPVY